MTTDLPPDEGGEDLGTSALELFVLSVAGCISTIFALVARRRRLLYDGLEITLRAERPRGAPTITAIRGEARLRTSATREEAEVALALTLRTCPVGVVLHKAGIPIEVRAVVEPPGPGISAATTALG